MIVWVLLLGFATVTYWATANLRPATKKVVKAATTHPHLAELLEYAERHYRERQFAAAEKAYLGVLKLDHKHVRAYSRLGIIYTAQHHYDDAIECFQLAARLAPSGQNYHNLGLAYHENANYLKAIAALEKANMFEPTAARFGAIAKAYQKLSNPTKMIDALERAVELEPSVKMLTQLAECYAANHERTKAEEAWRRVLVLDPQDRKARHFVSTLTAA